MSNIKALFLVFLLSFILTDSVSMAASETPPASKAPASVAEMPMHILTSAAETHAPVRLRPGKPQILRLDSEVGDVKVDDMSSRLTAVVYDNTSVALVPHQKGGAHITVFDKKGAPLMSRYVLIAEPTEKYLRLRQTCKKEKTASCEKTRIFYCPDLCYETRVVNMAQTAQK